MVVDLTSGPEGQWFKYLNCPPDNKEEAQQRFRVDAVDPPCNLGARLRPVCMDVHGSCSICSMHGMHGIIIMEIYTQIKIKQKLQQSQGDESQ